MQQRIVLVTGSNRGIGHEVARQLVEQGDLVIVTARSGEAAEMTAQALAATGGSCFAYELDLIDDQAIAKLVDWIKQRWGQVDVLINNAAIYPDPGRRMFEVDVAIYREAMQVNVWGPLQLCQAFVPGMIKNTYGRVVNVSSGAGQWSELTDSTTAYRLSKTALNALTKILADAVGSDSNVLVNAVCPGWVRTDMGGSSAPRSIEQGAETVIWLANLQQNSHHGLFFRDRSIIPWWLLRCKP